jgi:hypothetical protein
MAEDKKSDDGRGTPATGEGVTTAPRSLEGRNLPGGSMEAAARPIGINAVDRDMLPSRGLSHGEEWFQDSPEEPSLRRAPAE